MKNRIILVSMWAAFAAVSASAQLENSGFETGDFTGWVTFGQGWRTGVGADALEGAYGAVNDVLTNDVDGFRGVFQNVSVTAGLTYNAGVYIRAVSVEDSQSWFELQWLDGGGGVISQLQSALVTADQPYSLAGLGGIVAPVGAVTASVRGIVFMASAPAVDADFHIFDSFFIHEQPALSVAPDGTGSLVVSWSTNAPGYVLENVTNLVAANWSEVPESPVVSGDRFVVTNDAGSADRGFRLSRP